MGNCSSFVSLHLNEEEEKRLKNFVLCLDGKEEKTLCFVVLEGDCVLTTITRLRLLTEPNKLRFGIYRYFSDENGRMKEYFNWMPRKECLECIEKYVSSDGALAFEDPNGKAHLLCLKALGRYWKIRDESASRLKFPSDLRLSNLRSAMKSAMNHGNC